MFGLNGNPSFTSDECRLGRLSALSAGTESGIRLLERWQELGKRCWRKNKRSLAEFCR